MERPEELLHIVEHPRNQGQFYYRLLRIETEPKAKPRMTQRDKWKKRPIVVRWNAYKDIIRLFSPPNFDMPLFNYWMIFTFKLPKSYHVSVIGTPHQQTPDKDNLEKGILDIFLPGDDSKVFDGRVTKLWGDTDSIEIWRLRDGLGAG